MKIRIIAVGTKMPAWVEAGIKEYQVRMPPDFELQFIEIAMAQRSKGTDIQKAIEKEARLIQQAILKNDYVIALDETGKLLATEAMASRVGKIRDEGQNIAMLIGGPDGLSQACRQQADAIWSLSPLTFPHPIVRILIAEQLYRVWSVLQGHPYHRK